MLLCSATSFSLTRVSEKLGANSARPFSIFFGKHQRDHSRRDCWISRIW